MRINAAWLCVTRERINDPFTVGHYLEGYFDEYNIRYAKKKEAKEYDALIFLYLWWDKGPGGHYFVAIKQEDGSFIEYNYTDYGKTYDIIDLWEEIRSENLLLYVWGIHYE